MTDTDREQLAVWLKRQELITLAKIDGADDSGDSSSTAYLAYLNGAASAFVLAWRHLVFGGKMFTPEYYRALHAEYSRKAMGEER
jgi:hypothetical protein